MFWVVPLTKHASQGILNSLSTCSDKFLGPRCSNVSGLFLLLVTANRVTIVIEPEHSPRSNFYDGLPFKSMMAVWVDCWSCAI
jgi:hypothetical protein